MCVNYRSFMVYVHKQKNPIFWNLNFKEMSLHYKKNSHRQHTLHNNGLEKFHCANPTYNGKIFFLNILLFESGTNIGYVNYCLNGNLQNLRDKLYFWNCCVTLLTQSSSNRCESKWLRQWFLTRCCVIQTAVTFHLKK